MKKEILIYQSKTGKIEFRGDLKKDTIWGNLNQISELFNISQPVVSRHINNIFTDKEIDKKSNMQKMHIAFSVKKILAKKIFPMIYLRNLSCIRPFDKKKL